MKKFLKIFLTLVLTFVLTGCFNTESEENDVDDVNKVQDNNESRERTINDLEELAGIDPLVERFPNSVRTNCVVGVFCIYVAEATIEEVLDFYRDKATERGNPFNHEIVPEDQPHWVNTTEDMANPQPDQFSFTLGEDEDSCKNCVSWVLFSTEWPE